MAGQVAQQLQQRSSHQSLPCCKPRRWHRASSQPSIKQLQRRQQQQTSARRAGQHQIGCSASSSAGEASHEEVRQRVLDRERGVPTLLQHRCPTALCLKLWLSTYMLGANADWSEAPPFKGYTSCLQQHSPSLPQQMPRQQQAGRCCWVPCLEGGICSTSTSTCESNVKPTHPALSAAASRITLC